MQLSERSLGSGAENAIARERRELAARGVRPTDLTDTNPTRHGLLDPEVLAVVARATTAAAVYDPSPRGPMPAREALAARYGGTPDEYWLTSSTSQAYAWLFTVLADPGEAVAVPAPGYPLLDPLAELAGLTTWRYWSHYVHPHGWMCDTATLRGDGAATARPPEAAAPGTRAGAAVSPSAVPRTRAVVAVSPGNPTGAYVDATARAALVDACDRLDATLIADEVFHPFSLDGESAPRLAGEEAVPTCGLDGLSKLLCAPQLKLGWLRLTGPRTAVRPLARALDRVADAFLPVGGPVAAALPELLGLADAAVARTRERLAANLGAARRVLGPEPYRVRACEGGWMCLVDVPRYRSDDHLAQFLLRDAHLAVHPGWFYDLAAPGTLALSLLPGPEAFAEGCELLRTAIDTLA